MNKTKEAIYIVAIAIALIAAMMVMPAAAEEKPDLIVTAINSYHNNTGCPAWFNLSNEIDVTVKNDGAATAGASNVCLYIKDVFFGKLPVLSLAAGASEIVTFKDWMPVGEDCLLPPCDFEWPLTAFKDYNFTGVADCDNDVAESDETNNEATVVDRACYNGYLADEPLENVAHGKLHGHLIFTTGDGRYKGLYSVGSTQTTNYDITLPAGASVELAHLNVYYTWNKPEGTCPEMEVSITTPGGTTYTLPLMKAYNDVKCTCPGATWVLPFGNYVYDVSDYITESGTYTVTVKNVCTACAYFCPAAPGIVLVYEDENAPMIEYWINEGADVLMGGRRYPTSSNLAWWENINNATFTASTETGEVVNATLGVVSPWGGSSWAPGMTNYLFFNDVKLGTGVYHGYQELYGKTIDCITMEVNSTNAQVGVNVTDVTALYLNASDNVVGQADDGDNMMPANAFLVVEYGVPPVIQAGVRIEPDVLNLGSQGDFTAYITLPEGYDVAKIDIDTVICEGAPALSGTVAAADNGTLVVKFDRANLSDDLPTGEVVMTVTGNLFNGTAFEGSDTVTLTHGVEPTPTPGFWVSDSDIKSGLGGIFRNSVPTVFNMDGTYYLISGEGYHLGGSNPNCGSFHGFVWTGSTWRSDSGIVAGSLVENRRVIVPTVFFMDGTWYLISGDYNSVFDGYNWTGSAWQSDPAIVSGLDIGLYARYAKPTVFYKDGTWYLICGENSGEFHGFEWNGESWVQNRGIVSGLARVVEYSSAPTVFNKDGAWYLISGRSDGNFTGWMWTGHRWESDSDITSGLGDIGQSSAPTVFNMDGAWHLISGEAYGGFYGFRYQEI